MTADAVTLTLTESETQTVELALITWRNITDWTHANVGPDMRRWHDDTIAILSRLSALRAANGTGVDR